MILATDDFNRADNADLGALWDMVPTLTFAFKVLSNAAAPASATVYAAESYNGITWPDDQYAQAEVTAVAGGAGIGVLVRVSVVDESYYALTVARGGSPNVTLLRMVIGVGTILATETIAFTDGDAFRLEVVGTMLRVFARGIHFASLDVDDGAVLTGRGGVINEAGPGSAVSLDNWEGGVPDSAYGSRDWSRFPKNLLIKPLGVR